MDLDLDDCDKRNQDERGHWIMLSLSLKYRAVHVDVHYIITGHGVSTPVDQNIWAMVHGCVPGVHMSHWLWSLICLRSCGAAALRSDVTAEVSARRERRQTIHVLENAKSDRRNMREAKFMSRKHRVFIHLKHRPPMVPLLKTFFSAGRFVILRETYPNLEMIMWLWLSCDPLLHGWLVVCVQLRPITC